MMLSIVTNNSQMKETCQSICTLDVTLPSQSVIKARCQNEDSKYTFPSVNLNKFCVDNISKALRGI